MGGEIGAGPVERQIGPAAAEGRDPAITVLQIEQPLAPARAASREASSIWPSCFKAQRAGSIIGIGHTAGQGRPGPATGRGVGKGMHLAILLLQEPLTDGRARVIG